MHTRALALTLLVEEMLVLEHIVNNIDIVISMNAIDQLGRDDKEMREKKTKK